VSAIDSGRAHSNLSSALRLFVLDHYRAQIEEDGRILRLSGIEQHGAKARRFAGA